METVYGYKEAEDRMHSKYRKPMAIPHDVKEAIKSIYLAGVTRPHEIMMSLVEDEIMEEGSFPINMLYNYLKNMKIQMGLKKRSKKLPLTG